MKLLPFTKRLFISFLFGLMSLATVQAQGWYKIYPELFPQEPSDYFFNANSILFEGVVETSDQGFLTWGATGYNVNDWPQPNTLDIILTKMDVAGEVQWTNTYVNGSSDAFTELLDFRMAPSPDGNGFWGIGTVLTDDVATFRAIHLDEAGTILNSFEWSEIDVIGTTSSGSISTTKITNIIPSPDNTFIVLGTNLPPFFSANSENNFSWLSKIDLNGNVVWSSILDDEISGVNLPQSGIVPSDILTTTLMMTGLDVFPSGEIVTAGICYEYGHRILFKYDASGNELWSQNGATFLPNITADVLAHPNGDIFVQGYEYNYPLITAMNRISTNGDTIWTDTSEVNGFAPYDFCLLSDGNIGRLEIQQDGGNADHPTRFSIIDVDNNYLVTGDPFAFYINSYYSYSPPGTVTKDLQLIPTSDNGMVLAGMYNHPYNQVYPYLAKPDPSGSIPITEVSGYVFVDGNDNCIYEEGEIGIPYTTVNAGILPAITDINGYYEFNIPADNDYTLSTGFGQDYPEDLWTTDCDDSLEISLANDDDAIGGLNFGFVPLYDCPRLVVDAIIPFLRPGFTNFASLSYSNLGTEAEDSVSISFTMDSIFTLVSSSNTPPYTFDSATNTYSFFVGTVGVMESGRIYFGIETPEDLELGATPCFEAVILPFDRCNIISEEWDGSEMRVTGTCEGDSIRFTLENIGEEDMQLSREYSVYADHLLIQAGDIQLTAGETMDVKKFANGLSYRMEAEQSPNFPEPSSPQATIEMCGNDVPLFSMGFVDMVPLDDERHYIDRECVEVTASFDPNDKLVSPSGIGSSKYVNSDIELEYTIRFQNTGNDTAFNVFVLDTLSEFLDLNTFEVGAATHNYELSMLPGRVLRWDFPNILLPDSTTNWIGSNGAVKFSIRTVSDIPQPTEIHNTAAIYFDFNEPVITEDIFVTICDECLIQTLASDGVYFDGKVLLEGPYDSDGLMTNNLQDLIPMNQPFANFPYDYDGNEQLSEISSNMVDWVLVEARSGTPATNGNRATTTVETKAAILLNDGSIRGLDGISGVRFVNLTADEPYHFCIRHRNHLDVLTATAMFPTENMVYDFTTGTSQALGAAQLKWFGADAKAVMYSGDFNSDGVIQTTDYDMWAIQPAAVEVYDMPDANLDGVIQVSDYDKWFFNKAKVGTVEIGF